MKMNLDCMREVLLTLERQVSGNISGAELKASLAPSFSEDDVT